MKLIVFISTFSYALRCSIAEKHGHAKSHLRVTGNKTKDSIRKIEESNFRRYVPGSHCGAMAEDNYEELPPYNDQILNFTSASGMTFKVPGDNEYLKSWGGVLQFLSNPHDVYPLRNSAEVRARAALGNCTPTLDALAWIMNKINSNDRGNNFMVIYGDLIHMHREGDFVNATTGKEFDDDVDMMASLETIVSLGNLENELFATHGWSINAMVNKDGYTVFMQVQAVCRHPNPRLSKIGSEHPAIDVYPLAIVDIGNGKKIAKDLWQGSTYLQSQVYPVQCVDLDSAGTDQTLHLQIPRKSVELISCIYGDWQVRSRTHAGKNNDCTEYKAVPTIPSQADADNELNAVVCHSEEEYLDNTIKDDGRSLNFTSNNKTFYLPMNNNTLLKEWNGLVQFAQNPKHHVTYLRNTTELVLRAEEGNCTSTLDVFAWIMDKLNERHLILMIGYGELIHVHREKDFVNSTTGDYIDDDIDTWATFDTIAYIGALEEELFHNFGWSMRAFVSGENYVVFIQIMATCGHVPIAHVDKCKSSQPAIELYPIATVDMGGSTRIVKDLWQNIKLADTLIFPPKCINFQSSGREDPIHLQIPGKAIKVLNCLYGDWNVKSSKHAGLSQVCQDDTEII